MKVLCRSGETFVLLDTEARPVIGEMVAVRTAGGFVCQLWAPGLSRIVGVLSPLHDISPAAAPAVEAAGTVEGLRAARADEYQFPEYLEGV